MNWRFVVFGLVFLAGAFLIISSTGEKITAQQMEGKEGSLPESLDQFYPPNKPIPLYQITMIELAHKFSGTVSDILENDMDNAALSFEAFKESYIEVSEMVPEWKEKFPIEPVEKFGEAISTKDISQIMPTVGAVGRDCYNCHISYMVPAQQKYRWDNFGELVLTDPLSGDELGFVDLMRRMESNYVGIHTDLIQGQNENATKQFAGFKTRFEAISEACMICHNTERYYYVSEDITDIISKLEIELSKPEADIKAVDGYMQAIGQESCSKCHLVHIPAAYGQRNMNLYQ